MKHETYIPPEQTEETAQIRIQSPHENSGRPQGHPQTQTHRAQRTYCLKVCRLTTRAEFRAIAKAGNRSVGRFLCIDRRPAPSFRFGMTVSRKYGNSPERNRFKRIVRAAIRSIFDQIPPTLEIHVLPRQKAKEAKMGDIQEELLALILS